jgi:beta-N-acetylhexosaminidase
MSGTTLSDPAAARSRVRSNHLGSVFLAGRSSHPAAAVRVAIARLANQTTAHATIRPLVAIDQEGGKVQSLSGGRWIRIPSANAQGDWSASTLTSRTRAWAEQLRTAGISMDLAPVADTVPAGTSSDNPPIGVFDRQFGSNPEAVAASVATVTSTVKAAGVIATLKHFPGLGRVRANTDTSTKAVDPITTTDDPYLTPFQDGIAAGAGAVMISSATYPQIDPANLAVFSPKVITGLLRQQLGYQGVVITDDIGKAVAVTSVPVGRRAVRFIAAGGDLVLTVPGGTAEPMVKAIRSRAATDSAFRAQVEDSTLRILRLKQEYGLLTCH